MAIGVSTQCGPLKTPYPSPFWFSPPFRSSTSKALASSPAFSTSRKPFHRRDLRFHVSAIRTCYDLTAVCRSLQFKRDSSSSIGLSVKRDAPSLFDEVENFSPPPYWKLEVRTEMKNPSTSSARMFPYYPNQIRSKEKLLPDRLGNFHRVNEERKQASRDLHGPLVRDTKTIPPLQPNGWRTNPEGMESNAFELPSDDWLEESIKVRKEKCRVRLELPPEQTTVKSDKFKLDSLHISSSTNSLSTLSSDNIVGKKELQNSFSQEHIKLNNQRILGPLFLPNSDGEIRLVKGKNKATLNPHLFSENRAFHARDFNEVGCKVPTGINSRQTGLSLTEIGRTSIRSNDILSPNERKEILSELAGVSSGDVIEKGTFKRKSETQIDRKSVYMNGSFVEEIKEEHSESEVVNGQKNLSNGKSATCSEDLNETYIVPLNLKDEHGIRLYEHREKLSRIFNKVLVVDSVSVAKDIVRELTTRYRHLVHACDTEVAKIDVKQETPVDHGEVICFSIYSGPEADFGNGKSCIWIDILDGGGKDLLVEFAPFFEDPSIRKVWHNYSFDSHVLENYGLKLSGFHADTMHMARLWDSSRRIDGGYSLEALTRDPKVMFGTQLFGEKELIGKISMKTIFGKRKVKKDGTDGKLITIAPVEELQREERIPWICYSALDAISTLKLFESLKTKLTNKEWKPEGLCKGNMYDFYEKYWRPFGELLVRMETEGMLVDRKYLAEMEKVAVSEQQVAIKRFRNWASKYCPDAMYMNVGSDAQLRQLFFGGMENRRDPAESLPAERTFKVPNIDNVIEEGKKVPTKFRNITLHRLGDVIQTEMYTATGWPSVSGDALKALAGKVSAENNLYDLQSDDSEDEQEELMVNEVEGGNKSTSSEDIDTSTYGTAYTAFGGKKKGRDACHAIASLCEVCSIDSLISNFIIPLQGSHISGKNGRVHCSLNINTETGRLSARRPNLQNQPALEKDRYKIRQAFIAAPGNSLIVADYGQLELRILAHLANCRSMLNAFKAGGDFHSRTAMNMYTHIREAVDNGQVLLEWYPQPGEEKPPVPLLKDAFASERRKAKMLNFSIAYGKTAQGLARDWKVSVREARETVNLWYKERKEVRMWQKERKEEALTNCCVHTLLGRARTFPSMVNASSSQQGHIERAAINTPVQGSAADVAMCAMLEISRNTRLKELGWRLLLQVHDEVILEGPSESAEEAKDIVVNCMSKPFNGTNLLKVDLAVDAKCAQNWYAAK